MNAELGDNHVELSEGLRELMGGRRYCLEQELTRSLLLTFLRAKGDIRRVSASVASPQKKRVTVQVEKVAGGSVVLQLDCDQHGSVTVGDMKVALERREGTPAWRQMLFLVPDTKEEISIGQAGRSGKRSDDGAVSGRTTPPPRQHNLSGAGMRTGHRQGKADPRSPIRFSGPTDSQSQPILKDTDTICDSCSVLLLVRTVAKDRLGQWSRTLRSNKPGNTTTISVDGTVLTGNSNGYNNLSAQGYDGGVGVWTVKLSGSNRMWLGVATADIDLDAEWGIKNEWSVHLASRTMAMARQAVAREDGPETFSVPCTATVIVDCDNGTLAIKIGDVDLGVVCARLPKKTMLHLRMGLRHPLCTATLIF